MHNWKTFVLGDLGFFFGGVTGVKKDDYGHGYPFLQYTNVYKNWKVDIHNLELMNVKRSDLEKRNCIYGDIFFTAASETEDEVAMSSVLLNHVNNLTYNGFTIRYRLFDFNTLLPEFARYLFRSSKFRGDVYQRVNGDIRFNISQKSLAEIPISLPPLPEQRAIAGVLSSLDDKIDLLHRQNETLEALAQTLFRQWFVEEAEDDWEEISLFEAIDLLGGGTPKTSEERYWNGGIPWLSGSDISTNHKSFVNSSIKTISQEGLDHSSTKLLPKFSTVITARGTVGKYCILAEPMAFSQTNYGIKPKFENCFFFTYLLIDHSVTELMSAAYGSVFDTITTRTFQEFHINIPTDYEIMMFEEQVWPYFQKMKINQNQIHTLEKLRDTLLPKLMNGEVRVIN